MHPQLALAVGFIVPRRVYVICGKLVSYFSVKVAARLPGTLRDLALAARRFIHIFLIGVLSLGPFLQVLRRKTAYGQTLTRAHAWFASERQTATFSPIDTLPVELFLHVLLRVSLADRIRAGLVCRRWRRVVQHSAELWSFVKWTGRRPAALQGILQRSLGSPVSLHIILHHSVWADIDLIRTINTHLSHTRELRIVLNPLSVDKTLLLNAMLYALFAPAPVLERFSFQIGIDDIVDRRPRLNRRLFAGRAPRLQHVVLDLDLSLATDCGALANVTHLTLPSVRSVDVHLLAVLCPRLQGLTLNIYGAPTWHGRFPLILSRLTLRLPFASYAPIDEIAAYFRFDQIRQLQLSNYYGLFTTLHDIDTFHRVLHRASHLAINLSDDQNRLSYKFVSTSGQTLIVDNVHFDARWVDDTFTAVTHIVIQEACLIGSFEYFPRLPRVRSFEIELRARGQSSAGSRNLWIVDMCIVTGRHIYCPDLREVRITNNRDRHDAAFDAQELLQLVDCIDFRAPTLESLFLIGIELLPSPGDVRRSLLRKVHTMQCGGKIYI